VVNEELTSGPATSSVSEVTVEIDIGGDNVAVGTGRRRGPVVVSFANTMKMQEYSLVACEHPSNRDGFSLSLDWENAASYI
jgi:hypothetical protein